MECRDAQFYLRMRRHATDELGRLDAAVRVDVARGIIAYSEVTHPFPELRRNVGTVSSTLAVQITRVLPTSMSTDPSAAWMKCGVILTGRICVALRPSVRMIHLVLWGRNVCD